MSVVKIGVVGGGKMGLNHLQTFRQMEYSRQAELVALADVSPKVRDQRAEQFGIEVYEDFHDMLDREDLDAVSVVTPDHLHTEVAVAAAKAGKHVLVEKPMDLTVEGCQEMIEAARAAGVLLMVAFHKRYDPEHRNLENAIAGGRLGKILYGYVHMEDRIEVPTEWFPQWAPGSSPAWFLGVHFYDLVRWMLKSNPRRVCATGHKEKLLRDFGIDAYDAVQAKVEFDNGASVVFDTAWILPNQFQAVVDQGLRLVGTEGVWAVDTQNRGSLACTETTGTRSYNNFALADRKDKWGRTCYSGYVIECMQDFVDNVSYLMAGGSLDELHGRYPSGEDGREVTRMAAAVHESVRRGAIVDLHADESNANHKGQEETDER